MEVFWISTLTEEPRMGGDANVVFARLLVCTFTAEPPHLGDMLAAAVALGVIDTDFRKGVTQRIERIELSEDLQKRVTEQPDHSQPGVKSWVLSREA